MNRRASRRRGAAWRDRSLSGLAQLAEVTPDLFEVPRREAPAQPAPRLRRVDSPPASAPRVAPAELWLGVHLPWLTLECLEAEAAGRGAVAATGRAAAVATPARVVVEREQRLQRVLVVNDVARGLGVQPGMSLAAALALAPHLEALPRDPQRERRWLERLAALALRFTPRVSLEPPDGVVLEVRGSLGLFGGDAALCELFAAECAASGMQVQIALAPTPLAALAGARSGARLRVLDRAQLVGGIANLSLAALRWPEEALARLASMGVRSVGQAVRLPRAGFTKRFGKTLRESLDRLLGERTDLRAGFATRERFRGRCEPGYEIEHTHALLAVLVPLLDDLERFLRTRQFGITEIRCRFRHRSVPATRCVLKLAAPEASSARFAALLGERLAALTLPAPVVLCELRSGPLLARPLASTNLWQPGEHGGGIGAERLAFLEDLRARLGAEHVHALEIVGEHRPEATWRVAEPGARRPLQLPWSPSRRPLWLLREPRRLASRDGRPRDEGELALLEGPERIESGWWDGRDVSRDYYVARDERGARLWIFRERTAPHEWFLHGVFG